MMTEQTRKGDKETDRATNAGKTLEEMRSHMLTCPKVREQLRERARNATAPSLLVIYATHVNLVHGGPNKLMEQE